MTDSVRLPDPRPAVMALATGSCVIVRHYDDPARGELVRSLIALCRSRGIAVLVAGDARLALAVNADGLHLPESMLAGRPADWRLWLRPDMLLSVAAHSPKALATAAAAGADFALLSPVFPTGSHPGAASIGVSRLAAWVSAARLPVFALGGVNAGNKDRILAAGCVGWAAIRGLDNAAVHRR